VQIGWKAATLLESKLVFKSTVAAAVPIFWLALFYRDGTPSSPLENT
jgi:hypothetical protein